MGYNAVLFDLDGTLLDTSEDIACAVNCVLAELGLPPAPDKTAGDGIARFFGRALPPQQAAPADIDRCVERFRVFYRQNGNARATGYEGVSELLAELWRRRTATAVLSNKLDEFAKTCVADFFPHAEFRMVLGQTGELPRKPDPAGALLIARTLGLPPEQFVYLGDTGIDIQTAIAAGMHPIGALWGFRSEEELLASGAQAVIRHPLDLLGILDGTAKPA